MRILTDSELQNDLQALSEAWEDNSSFALVPEKSGSDRGWVEKAVEALPPDLQQGHFALLTSGSTGKPKLVVGSRRRAERLAQVLHQVQDSEQADSTIQILPLTYCFAFVNQWLWARVMKRKFIATKGLSHPRELLDVLSAGRSALLCMVGAQVPLFEKHFQEHTFAGVCRLHFAGGAFPQTKLDSIQRLFPQATIFNNYGCAEAMPRLTCRLANASEKAENIGSPIPGVTLRIAENGHLQFTSPYGAVAFVNETGLKRIEENELVDTGDFGEENADGTWSISGRSNEVFKRYGEKLAVPQILATIGGAWPGATAHYLERDGAGEMGYVLVLSPKPDTSSLRQILQALRASHPRTHWPLSIQCIEDLPRLPSGKLDTNALGKSSEMETLWRQFL